MKYQALRPHFFSVVGGWRVLGVGGWWWGGSWGGWVGGDGVGWYVVMGWVGLWVVGGWGGGVVGVHDTPHHGGALFFDNLVKKLDQIVKK